MWKYNKYNIGDIVGHLKSPSLKFRVINVLSGVPEKKGTYGYAYCQIFDEDKNNMENVFDRIDSGIYIEKDLFFIRKPTRRELTKMLKEALGQKERYDGLASTIQKQISTLKP